jgi:twinfilin
MLYASSRSTLISTLGLRTQRLSNQIIATSKPELLFPSSDDSSVSFSELSIREKELAEVKAAEAEGAHGTSKRSTNLISSSGVAFPISHDARDAIASLATTEGEELVQLVRYCWCVN